VTRAGRSLKATQAPLYWDGACSATILYRSRDLRRSSSSFCTGQDIGEQRSRIANQRVTVSAPAAPQQYCETAISSSSSVVRVTPFSRSISAWSSSVNRSSRGSSRRSWNELEIEHCVLGYGLHPGSQPFRPWPARGAQRLVDPQPDCWRFSGGTPSMAVLTRTGNGAEKSCTTSNRSGMAALSRDPSCRHRLLWDWDRRAWNTLLSRLRMAR